MIIHEIICDIIFTYLDFYDQHKFRRISCHNNKNQIKNLYYIDMKYLSKLDDNILQNYKFATKLYAGYNPKITNVNHMTKLKELNANGNC